MPGSHDSDESPDSLDAPPSVGDSLEQLLADAVAAPSSMPSLTTGTVVGERFVVERMLGAGGMGAVYLARDRVLERPVALKLHRTTSSEARLHREAVAMAKLAHPNVVTVFEVGTHDARAFVAMEYVEGLTLRGWLAAGPRRRAEILDVLLAAGEGLAAAHDAELVHRDVKPDNILIGRDGRTRIGDFGLAQTAAVTGLPIEAPLTALTKTGTVVGTPAYMAPEQLDGGLVDARTDQFGFCVVIWEALCGERPFGGADTRELRTAITRGASRVSPGKLPARFRRVLTRGLALDPATRWPSMRALLAALRSARRRPAVVAASAAGVLLAASTATWTLWPAHDPLAACEDTVAHFDRALPVEDTTRLAASVRAAGGPEADARASVISRVLDVHRERARQITRDACRAHASRQWSPELARASDECLADQARAVKEILGAVPATRANSADLVRLAGSLPEVERCADARVLAGWRSLAADPAQLPAILAARGHIEAALAKLEAGQVSGAVDTVAALDPAIIQAPAVKDRVELARGMIEVAKGNIAAGEKRLADAYFAARASDDGELALRIVGELIRVASVLRRDQAAADRWVKNGVADAEREHVRHPNAAASVYLRAASAATIHGDGESALKLVERSEALRGSLPATVNRGGAHSVRADAHALVGNTDAALAASDEYLSTLRVGFGERHPAVAEALADRATLLLAANRAKEAAAAAREAGAIIDAEGETTNVSIASVKLTLGATLLELQDPAARRHLEQARDIWVATYGEDHPDVALADTNLAIAYLDDGEIDRALAALRQAAAVTEKTIGPDHVDLASVLYNLAVAERGAKQLDAALATSQRVAGIFERTQKGSVRHVFSLGHIAMVQNLMKRHADALATADAGLAMARLEDEPTGPAWLQLEAGRALLALGRDVARAQQLLAQARAAYAAANLAERVAEIDELRRAR